ncbi:MAG TPA: TIGR03619 family F420-dependent LLM class oxidoreductase [Trebonia sp.]|jgi:probable F420-dependent oxidoreductase|nr:TIGR03619 family F420-dependent LLM class oxidoreductase [Trebonia sp.]
MDSTTSHSTTRHGGIAIGIGAPLAGAWATPQNLTRFARQAESLGYRSLWTFQRLFVPDGSDMPPVYRSVLDPLVALGYAAAVTSTVRLGVAVLNHPFASPLLMAKQAATVDVLSGGRLDLGLGIGWLAEEFTGSGAVMSQRGPRTTEYVAALRALWSADGVTQFSGEHYEIPAGRQDPPPVQGQGTGRPGPPVILGGMSRPAIERAGRIADGWVTASAADLSQIGSSVALVQETAAAHGRGPLRIICRGVVRPGPQVTSPRTGERLLLSGSFEQIRADAGWLATQGVTEIFYDLNWDPAIGNPAADPLAATERAAMVLEALAPRTDSTASSATRLT